MPAMEDGEIFRRPAALSSRGHAGDETGGELGYDKRRFPRMDKERMMEKRRSGLLLLGLIVLWAGAIALSVTDEARSVRRYLHPQARIEACPESHRSPAALTAEQALARAVEMFIETGVRGLCICEMRWIEAPVSGYLVDALGDLEMKITHGSLGEEGRYSLFRLGVADRPLGSGSPFPCGAGEGFAFVAKGVDPEGRPKWYPPPVLTDVVAARLRGDPDSEADFKFPLVYFIKYFQDRERFASLPERYSPCGSSGK
jgi:hypothetical protein